MTVNRLPGGMGIPYFPESRAESAAMTTAEESIIAEWHERYGHIPLSAFSHIREASHSLHLAMLGCSVCAQGKAVKPSSTSLSTTTVRTTWVGELVYSDLCGPFRTQAQDIQYHSAVREAWHKTNIRELEEGTKTIWSSTPTAVKTAFKHW